MHMEKKVRKKRPQGASPQGGRNKPAGSGTGKHSLIINSKESSQPAEMHANPVHSVLGIPINFDTARQAVILSEIIGKPVSKRGRRR